MRKNKGNLGEDTTNSTRVNSSSDNVNSREGERQKKTMPFWLINLTVKDFSSQ